MTMSTDANQPNIPENEPCWGCGKKATSHYASLDLYLCKGCLKISRDTAIAEAAEKANPGAKQAKARLIAAARREDALLDSLVKSSHQF